MTRTSHWWRREGNEGGRELSRPFPLFNTYALLSMGLARSLCVLVTSQTPFQSLSLQLFLSTSPFLSFSLSPSLSILARSLSSLSRSLSFSIVSWRVDLSCPRCPFLHTPLSSGMQRLPWQPLGFLSNCGDQVSFKVMFIHLSKNKFSLYMAVS